MCSYSPHADPYNSTVWFDCSDSNGEYRNDSTFQQNLNRVLESLVRNVVPSGFNTSNIVVNGKNNNGFVYGLVQCSGGLNSFDCKHCTSIAMEDFYVTTVSFYNNYGNVYNGKNISACGADVTNQPRHFMNAVKVLLSKITAKAKQSPKRFVADSTTSSN